MAYKDPAEGRARDRERFRRRTAERIAQGLCPNCGKAPPEPERRLCAPCAGKARPGREAQDRRQASPQELRGGVSPMQRFTAWS